MEPKADHKAEEFHDDFDDIAEPIRITTVTEYAGASAQPPGLPLPPVGGDRWAWVRWAVTVGLILAGLWSGVKGQADTEEKVKELKAEVQALRNATPVPAAGK